MSPLITVIVPVYNAEKYLPRCIESVLAQTFADFELLLIEDGSPDGCGAICDAYAQKDSRIHVIHQQNRGVAATRNVGIEWALKSSQSQWITYIDSDDYVHEKYLEVLYRACVDNNVDFSTCNWVEVMDTSCPETKLLADYEVSVYTPEEAFVRNLIGYGPCDKLARKELYQNVRFPEGWRFAEDSATTYKIPFACPKVATIPLAIYYYQKNEGSLTRSAWYGYRLSRLISSEEQLTFFSEDFPLAYKKALEDTLEIITLFLHWRRRDAAEDTESFKKLKKDLRKYTHIYATKYGANKWKWYRYHVSLKDCGAYEKMRVYLYVLGEKLGLIPTDKG